MPSLGCTIYRSCFFFLPSLPGVLLHICAQTVGFCTAVAFALLCPWQLTYFFLPRHVLALSCEVTSFLSALLDDGNKEPRAW